MSDTKAALRGGGLYLPVGATALAAQAGERGIIVASDGSVMSIDQAGAQQPVGGGRDVRSIIAQTAASVLPAGFAEYFSDISGIQDHVALSTLDANSYLPITTESGGKRRLTTQAQAAVAEIVPTQNGIGVQLPLMINPKTSAWFVEGRSAIETHGANSLLFPCSIALTTGNAMQNTMANNTFCALGLAGTGYTGGNNSFLSFAASSAGTMLLQTTTIPWSAAIQAYGLEFDGAGTIYARIEGVRVWSTTNLNQIFSSAAGFHPNQWVRCSDTTVTTMLVDYLYGAGPRI
jgi:hypothetical protein